MKRIASRLGFNCAVCLLTALPLAAADTEQQTADPDRPRAVPQKISPAGEVLQMFEAGVSKEVIVTYIQRSRAAYALRPADLIAFKQKSVPDEIVTAMLRRDAELEKASPRTGPDTPAASGQPAASRAPEARIDPESYDFWWYHYAYPRALAYANRRVHGSYAPVHRSQRLVYPHYSRLPYRPRPAYDFRHE